MRHNLFSGQLGTVLPLSLGYLCLHLIGIGLLGVLLSPLFPSHPERSPHQVVLSEGRLLKYSTWRLTPEYPFLSLDGQPVEMRDKRSFTYGGYLDSKESQALAPNTSRPADWSTVMFMLGNERSEVWYYVQEKVGSTFTAYFVVYSNHTRAPLQYIGAKGQVETVPPPVDRFQMVRGSDGVFTDHGSPFSYRVAESMLDTTSGIGTFVNEYVVLLTQRGLEHVHLSSGQVEVVLPVTDLVSFAQIQELELNAGNFSQKSGPSRNTLVFRSEDTVYESVNGKITASYTIPTELREQGLTVYPIDAKTICYGKALGNYRPRSNAKQSVAKCVATGTVIENLEVKQPDNDQLMSSVLSSLGFAVLCPTPLQLIPILGFSGSGHSWVDSKNLLEFMWPSILLLLAFGGLSAWAATRLAPRCSGTPITLGWLIYVALLGLPGLVGFLMHFRTRHHPKLEPAEKLGTEIFR